MQSKRCSKCFQIKPLPRFSKQKGGLSGRKSECKACQVKANQEYRDRRRSEQQTKNQCWICELPLTEKCYVAELRRMTREGFGARLPKHKGCYKVENK